MTDEEIEENVRQHQRLGKRLGVRYVPFEDRYVIDVESGQRMKFGEIGQDGAYEWFDRLREEMNLG
jgi:hypothetical protein